LLPENFSLIGVDRLELSDQAFRLQIEEALRAFGNDKHYAQKLDEHHLENLLSRITYLQGDFSDPACYARLDERLQANAVTESTGEHVVFYLAVAARFFAGIVDQLGAAGLVAEGPNRWRRVVVEKPFGHDLESAKALNSQLRKSVAERQIYRMDHFLGKETVQNIMLMRFANGIFEPLWNRDGVYFPSASPAIVHDRDLLYIDDYRDGRDHFVVLRLSTGEKLASVALDAKLPTIGTIFVGMNDDVFLISSEAGTANGLVSRITLALDLPI
jgi:hypothetical protein